MQLLSFAAIETLLSYLNDWRNIMSPTQIKSMKISWVGASATQYSHIATLLSYIVPVSATENVFFMIVIHGQSQITQ